MKANALFKMPCEFKLGVAKIEQLPAPFLPELTFAGRSNVGKSSLLNALTKRKSLARTSKTPGCTRQLNFFLLGEKIHLVDIPGYGFAKASKKEVGGWNELINDYLLGRPNLKQVFLLIDARRGVKDNDIEIMKLLDLDAVSYQIILTKIDKQSQTGIKEIEEYIESLGEKHPALHPEILQTSSVEGTGIDSVRTRIAEFC